MLKSKTPSPVTLKGRLFHLLIRFLVFGIRRVIPSPNRALAHTMSGPPCDDADNYMDERVRETGLEQDDSGDRGVVVS